MTATKLAQGLLILAKYSEDVCAEHDEIYAGGEVELTPEDESAVKALGWFYGGTGWQAFV
jgi:hypothetical protein